MPFKTINNIKFDLYLPKNQKQVDQCIELIQSNDRERILGILQNMEI